MTVNQCHLLLLLPQCPTALYTLHTTIYAHVFNFTYIEKWCDWTQLVSCCTNYFQVTLNITRILKHFWMNIFCLQSILKCNTRSSCELMKQHTVFVVYGLWLSIGERNRTKHIIKNKLYHIVSCKSMFYALIEKLKIYVKFKEMLDVILLDMVNRKGTVLHFFLVEQL